jgi:iron complex outermembrane recepter protein
MNTRAKTNRVNLTPGVVIERCCVHAAVLLSSLAAVDTLAANNAAATEGERNLEEIVVTAQKRAERLQDVPISISVLGGAALDKATSGGVQEMLARVPGVTFEDNTQGNGTQVAVRGVSAAFSTVFGSSPIAYYVDMVPFGFVRSSILPDPDTYDLDRVEVLRGPQGTLYGAGGAGGVVRVLTKDADLNKFELKSRANLAHTEHGGASGRADLAVNVPIVEGKLAARTMVSYKDLSGWVDKPTRNDSNGSSARNLRFKLNGQPTDHLSFGLSAWSSSSDEDGRGWSLDGRVDQLPDVEKVSDDLDVYGVKLGYDFPFVTLTSSTGYLDYTSTAAAASETGVSAYIRPSAKTLSQEINLTSTHDGPWRWTAGAFYRDGEDRRWQRTVASGLIQHDEYTSESWAVFGELTREFFEGTVELTAGVRYFDDDVGIRELQRAVAVQPAALINRDSNFNATTPRVVLKWIPSPSLMTYVSYAEGFRSGGDQQPTLLAANLTLPPFEPDLLRNYEVGVKGDLLERRFSYDAAVYYLDWEDVQLPLAIPDNNNVLRALLTNGASADGLGAEFSFAVRPIDAVELGLSMSWNDLTTSEAVYAGLNNSVLVYPEDNRLNSSAEYTAGAFASYSFPLSAGGLTGRFAASADWSSRRDIRLYTGGTTVLTTHSDPLLFGRLSFEVDSQDHWTAGLYVDNVSNENGISNAFIFPAGATTGARSMHPRPRTYSLQLEYRY